MVGYSGTPLAKKIGVREGISIWLVNPPDYYFDLFTDMPEKIKVLKKRSEQIDMIHFFTNSQKELVEQLPLLKKQIAKNGMIWVSWPKKAAKIETDVTEDNIRDCALRIGLIDVKVCAVNDTWSGSKLVIPVKERG